VDGVRGRGRQRANDHCFYGFPGKIVPRFKGALGSRAPFTSPLAVRGPRTESTTSTSRGFWSMAYSHRAHQVKALGASPPLLTSAYPPMFA
jgi:hypothetical protein